jgi:NAD(P)H-nitrite reductase large subunit
MRHVLIGNSAAAVGAVEGIRQTGSRDGILIISGEPHHTYSRPLISYLLLGKTTEARMKFRGEAFYRDNGCEVRYGQATGIDPAAKTVTVDGEAVPYGKLLVATGSAPFVPPFPGLETVGKKFTFMSLADARALEQALDPGARVLIVGAGLIGLKCAEGILRRVANVTVVDLAPHILSSILDPEGAGLVQRHLEEQGLMFRLGRGVAGFAPGAATLDDGGKIPFDVLVLAVGVRPNVDLLRGVADLDRGVLVDTRMRTSQPDIFAAGDCAQGWDLATGQRRILALLPNAYMQGECAGVNMAGGDRVFDKAIPMNAIGFFGLHVLTAGQYTGEVFTDTTGGYKKIFYGDNKLNGYILIGSVEKAGVYTSLIREGTPLDTLDFPLICKKPGLMAFAREDRQVKLGRPDAAWTYMGVY